MIATNIVVIGAVTDRSQLHSGSKRLKIGQKSDFFFSSSWLEVLIYTVRKGLEIYIVAYGTFLLLMSSYYRHRTTFFIN